MLQVIMTVTIAAAIGALLFAYGAFVFAAQSKENSQTADASEDHTPGKTETAAFGAGCFWGVEDTFRQIEGVKSATSGYCGGTLKNPTYQAVCSGKTGHAETVEVKYDPSLVSYDKLLDVFWKMHDPTTLNRQGPDVGAQYRSVIFYYTPEQQRVAEASKAKLEASGRYKRPIVTAIEPASTFYPAEEYHQRYLEKHGMSSCHKINDE